MHVRSKSNVLIRNAELAMRPYSCAEKKQKLYPELTSARGARTEETPGPTCSGGWDVPRVRARDIGMSEFASCILRSSGDNHPVPVS